MILDLATHPRRFLTVAELIAYTRLPRATVYWHIEHQKLPVRRFGHRIRVETPVALEWYEIYVLPRQSESLSVS